MKSPLGPGSMPLWDLAGQALGKPVHELLGGKGPRQVPVYDGSIYFADLMPEPADRWQDRFRQEIDMGLARGHRAFKIKIGRGAKWMPAEEGFERDKAVLKIIRAHAGPDVLLGVDANNGYDLAGTRRLLADLPGLNLAFLEEMFPEDVAQCLDLKAFLAEHHLAALIADGETQGSLEALKPFMDARAVDICQLDMNRFGFEGILAEAALARPLGLRVGPHNWGSLVGYYMILQVGRAITNLYRAENDPLDTDVLLADGYAIQDGWARVPDGPGTGLRIDEAKFAASIKPKFDLKA
jgi:L-alanine-DL-glutamate epimerase-like enolase superfamily enzyme